MQCSPARLEANRRNAARSTGPRTDAGKQRSRGNALKHGLSGDGVVLPAGDVAAVDALAGRLADELAPRSALGEVLVRRMAVMSVRLERCERHDAAMTAKRVREAVVARDIQRRDEAEALGAGIEANPAEVVRRLGQTPEGIDWLAHAWEVLRAEVMVGPMPGQVGAPLEDRIGLLLGLEPARACLGAWVGCCRAVQGDFSGWADPECGPDATEAKRRARAAVQVLAWIDQELAALAEQRAEADDEDEAADRREAAARALFDPSRDAERARRFEAAAERGLFRALREFRKVEEAARSVAADRAEAAASDAVAAAAVPVKTNPTRPVAAAPAPVKTNPTAPSFEPIPAGSVLPFAAGMGVEVGPVRPGGPC